MRTYPKSTANQNVPKDAFLIAETSAMSGEIITTYYADRETNLWKVTDWKGSKPTAAYVFEVCKLTGDTLRVIAGRVNSYFRR